MTKRWKIWNIWSMLLKTTLRDFCEEFDVFLLEFLETKIKFAQKINPSAAQNLEEIKKLIIGGGKRIRPFLVFLGFSLFGQINKKNKLEIFKIGASLELFHTFALIHDDIIDNSLIRRNKPTVEQNYLDFFDNLEKQTENQDFQNQNPSKISSKTNLDPDSSQNIKTKKQKIYSEKTQKLASSAAILAGDYAHTLADSLINSVQNKQVQEVYYQMQFELVAGQIDDCFGISLQSLDKITKENVLNMLICKSGNYSIQKPLLMGMNLAVNEFDNYSNENFEEEFVKYGDQLGNNLSDKKIPNNQDGFGQNSDLQSLDQFEDLEKKLKNKLKEEFAFKIEERSKKRLEIVKMTDLLEKIGQDLGLIFQLVDDILGVFGEDSITGKSVESDLEGGKKTLLIIQTWTNSDTREKQIILANLGNKNGDFEVLRQLIKQKGLDYVQQMVNDLGQKSLQNAKKLQKMEQDWNKKNDLELEQNLGQNQNWQILLELIDYLKNRKS